MGAPPDPFNLGRFVLAQSRTFETALAELQSGRKRTHWMWYVCPQLAGLGHSEMAVFYAIRSLDEARAYLSHPVLGKRLTLVTRTVLGLGIPSTHALFGSPDDMKFGSSMTLFARVEAGRASLFREALHRFYGGQEDERTLALLDAAKACHSDSCTVRPGYP